MAEHPRSRVSQRILMTTDRPIEGALLHAESGGKPKVFRIAPEALEESSKQ